MDELDHNPQHDSHQPGQPDHAGLLREPDEPVVSGPLEGGPLLTAAQVAELLIVPESWVREHTRHGNLPHLKLGRYIRYRRQAVIAWITRQERSSP